MELSYVRQTVPLKKDISLEEYHLSLNKLYTGFKTIHTIPNIIDDLGTYHPDVKLFQTHCKGYLVEVSSRY